MAKKYEFVTVKAENNPVKDAVFFGHRKVIEEYAQKGYEFAGYVPVRFGPSGKTVEIDLIFELEE